MVRLGYTVLDLFQNLSSKGGESEQNIPRVVGGITRRDGNVRVLVSIKGLPVMTRPFSPSLVQWASLRA